MKVAIIDYLMGNVASVQKSLNFLNIHPKVTNLSSEVKSADILILPGVGSFQKGMENLHKLNLPEILNEVVLIRKKPVLGICLGMQLMATTGTEGAYTKGLGWIKGKVDKIPQNGKRIPHMGWNNITILNDKYFKTISSFDFYFVHSYHFKVLDNSLISSTTEYGISFTSSVQKDNIFGTQFHPEKSHKAGLQVLKNFFEYCA